MNTLASQESVLRSVLAPVSEKQERNGPPTTANGYFDTTRAVPERVDHGMSLTTTPGVHSTCKRQEDT